ncbi:MAG: nodulation protein NfeD [Ignavibacteriae bacterium]|nr:nodulation protein NfeD [Ignavibacteriota bacterium]
MKRILFILFVMSLFTIQNHAQKKVYVAEIDGMIDLGLAPFVKRVVDEAEKNSASAIIFKINTFGGRVDAATQIKDAILNSKVQTIAFIDKRAISAGALISLSCEKIIMVEGASIGATTVVDEGGTKQSEKAQSYMRAEMRSTAEKTGRRTDIAEGMVDERVVVQELNDDSTKLITLTSEEALKFGIADSVLNEMDDVLESMNLENAEVINLKSNWAEDFIRFLNNPIITSILLMIALVGLFTEIKTPGWGLPGTAALIALALFFGSGYILELASIIEIIIFVIGLVLLLIEIFIIPGFGITGIIGIILMFGSLFFGLISDFPLIDWDIISMAIIQFASTLVLTIIVIFSVLKFLPKSEMWGNLILKKNIEERSGYAAEIEVKNLIGKMGIALTDLRPSGIALIENKRIDVVTSGDYIPKETHVTIISEEGSKVVVEKVQ